MLSIRFIVSTAILSILLVSAVHAAAPVRDYYTRDLTLDVHFRDYYTKDDRRAYQDALKRKNFAARIQWKPLLIVAAENADLASVRWMLENGVEADSPDESGRTALYYLGTPEVGTLDGTYGRIARLLLEYGANPKRVATGTSVVWALTQKNRNPEVLRIVLDAGGPPDGDRLDISPPVCAAETPEMVDVLVRAGATLRFPPGAEFASAADCIASGQTDRRTRKTLLRHLERNYGIIRSR